MIIQDEKGNELRNLLAVQENQADALYHPLTHSLGVVKLGNDYLLGWNKWRQNWEIFGGCREDGETLRDCMNREGREELGLSGLSWTFLGLMHLKLAPDYFNPEWHYEYGGLFGISLPESRFAEMERLRTDREEIGKLAFYRKVKGKEKIAAIDEKLLEYWM